MLNITIDGRALAAREGQTVLEVAREAGIHIPTLCYLAERSAIGSCRVCVVDVEGQDAPVPRAPRAWSTACRCKRPPSAC